jgi:hypothetical protein
VGADYDTLGRLRIAPARLLAGCYVDLGRGVDATTLVVGTARSGSTWLAELLNHRNEYRLVFEPFRSDRVRRARSFRRGHYIDPLQQDHPLADSIDALLAGRVRGWWTDRQNRRKIATRRIVKEVRITNLIPWIRARHPELPIVYVVRDPVDVATSWLELGWGDDLDELLEQPRLMERFEPLAGPIQSVAANGDPVERHVLRWCLENAIPMRSDVPGVHRVHYERLRDEPEGELERLFAYVRRSPEIAPSTVRRPSATAGFRRQRAVTIGEAQRVRARELLELFGVAQLMGADGG